MCGLISDLIYHSHDLRWANEAMTGYTYIYPLCVFFYFPWHRLVNSTVYIKDDFWGVFNNLFWWLGF